MLHLFLVAFLLAGGTAEQDVDLDVDDSAPPIQVYNLDEVHRAQHHQHGVYQNHQQGVYQNHQQGPYQDHQHGRHNEYLSHQEPYNVHLHSVKGYKGQSKVDRIVSEFYNPDYYEPITVLDYRYVKSGGRDYSRDAGGQILILPKNVRINQKKEFPNYDEMLEFLRLKQLAEFEAHRMEMSKLGYDQRHYDHYERRIEINGRNQNDYRNQDRYGGGYGGYGNTYKRDADISSQEKQPLAETEKKAAA